MAENTSRFCVDCAHLHDIEGILRIWHCCDREECGSVLDPVDGERIYRKCERERADKNGACGPEGKLWEAR